MPLNNIQIFQLKNTYQIQSNLNLIVFFCCIYNTITPLPPKKDTSEQCNITVVYFAIRNARFSVASLSSGRIGHFFGSLIWVHPLRPTVAAVHPFSRVTSFISIRLSLSSTLPPNRWPLPSFRSLVFVSSRRCEHDYCSNNRNLLRGAPSAFTTESPKSIIVPQTTLTERGGYKYGKMLYIYILFCHPPYLAIFPLQGKHTASLCRSPGDRSSWSHHGQRPHLNRPSHLRWPPYASHHQQGHQTPMDLVLAWSPSTAVMTLTHSLTQPVSRSDRSSTETAYALVLHNIRLSLLMNNHF